MGKRIKKLTRQHKICLGKLDDEFRSANQIGARESLLDVLADHGLARAILDLGEKRYRITRDGRERQTNQHRPQGRA